MNALLSLAVVFATLGGPVLAVLVTRYIDTKRDQRRRRLEIFRMIMRTRRATLSVDHVTALNMVEIEFYDQPKVLAAYQDLFKHFNLSGPAPPDWWDKRMKLQTKLLSAMGKSLGYDFAQLEVLEGGYTPKGWTTAEQEQQELRRLLIDVCSGKRSLAVTPTPATPPTQFPPAIPPPPDLT